MDQDRLETKVEKNLPNAAGVGGTFGVLLKALRKFRKELDPIVKTAENPFFHSKYASLADIQQAIEPVLDANGLTLHCYFSEEEQGTMLCLNLYHDDGGMLPTSEYRIRCKQTETKVKDDNKGTVTETTVIDNPQDAGSGISYAVRYCISVYLGLTLADDDGNKASGNYGSQPQQRGKTAEGSPPKAGDGEIPSEVAKLKKKAQQRQQKALADGVLTKDEIKAAKIKLWGQETCPNNLDKIKAFIAFIDSV
jgi:hypothetical protein